MTSNDIHGVERGWAVKTLDGQNAGSVEEASERYILVKSGLLATEHRYLPAAALEHVRPEMKEIGLSLTQEEVEAGDWSQPPDHGPRTSGSALNVASDAEIADAMERPEDAEPEKPVHL